MYTRIVYLLAVIPLGTLVGACYSVKDWYQGDSFLDDWTFFTDKDPTNGNVNYLSKQDAQNQGLAYLNPNGSLVLAVDSTSEVSPGGNRNSVRITSNSVYNEGLFILDASAMPVGCGTWPSFWTNGPNWPMGGEIDIVEGINNQPHNQMTLHTGIPNNCTIDTSNEEAFTGRILDTNCYSTETANAGCSFSDTKSTSFGYGFNDADGGVFALLWDASVGMSIWHFARANIPSDITDQKPRPWSWGTPVGFWSTATCDISANFYQHSMIIDTTLCGDLAGSADAYSDSGCPGTCSSMMANASNFANAKWVINYVAVYKTD